jgi:hypothetical protein
VLRVASLFAKIISSIRYVRRTASDRAYACLTFRYVDDPKVGATLGPHAEKLLLTFFLSLRITVSYSRQLKREGFVTVLASNGQQAIDHIRQRAHCMPRQKDFDVILVRPPCPSARPALTVPATDGL